MTINLNSGNVTLDARARPADACPTGARPRPPRLAVLVVPARAAPRPLGLRRRLQARYGVEQFQQLSLTPAEWDAALAGADDLPEVERLRCRLALAHLGGARLVVVVGGGGAQAGSGADGPPRAWADVERLVARIRSWKIPGEVVGVWAGDGGSWSREARPVDHRDREYDDHWLAERTWEDDGGRVGGARRERPAKASEGGGRRRRVLRDHRRQPVHPGVFERRRGRHLEAGDVSRFRPGLAGLAAHGE